MSFVAASFIASIFAAIPAALVFAQSPPSPAGGAPIQDESTREQAMTTALSGTLIVLNKAEASASLIDLSTGKELARLATGEGPHEVAVSADGNTAVVANYGGQGAPGNSLTVIDLPSKSVTAAIDLGQYRRPHGIVFLEGGERIVVTVEGNKAVLVVNLASNDIEQVIETGAEVSHMIAVAPDGQRGFVANIGSGSVTVVDLASGVKVRDIPTAPGAEGIDISPDGSEVWVSNRQVDTLSIIDAASLEVVASVECASFPIRLKFTPDGARVLVSNARTGDVAVIDAKTREELGRIDMNEEPVDDPAGRLFAGTFEGSPVPVGILILPSGSHAFIANTQADVVTVLDLKTLKIVGRLNAGREPDGLGYSAIELK